MQVRSERVALQFLFEGSWAGITYLRYTTLTSSKKDETAVYCCDPALLVLIMFGVLKRRSRSINLAVYCWSLFIFLADQISCRSDISSVYRMRSLAVYLMVSLDNEALIKGFSATLTCLLYFSTQLNRSSWLFSLTNTLGNKLM